MTTNSLGEQISAIAERTIGYLILSPISSIFLAIMAFVFALNIIKRYFVWKQIKAGSHNSTCRYLITSDERQSCDLEPYRGKFEIERSCTGCKGKTVKMTAEDAEIRAGRKSVVIQIIILVANYGKAILPYISFIYALMTAVFATTNFS